MKKSKQSGLTQAVSSILEKHRDALSTDEVLTLEQAIEALQKYRGSDPKEYGKILEPIALNLLKFFTKPEMMEKLNDWFNN